MGMMCSDNIYPGIQDYVRYYLIQLIAVAKAVNI